VAAPFEGFVQRNPGQPRRELRPFLELVQVRVGIDIRLLHHVFHFTLVP